MPKKSKNSLTMKLFIIAIFFVIFNYVIGFDCYDCQNCEIPFNNQTDTTTCGTGITQCLKVTATLGTVYTYVSKQCGPCMNGSFIFGVTYLSVDCCSGSNCNEGIHFSTSRFSIIILLFSVYILNVKFNK